MYCRCLCDGCDDSTRKEVASSMIPPKRMATSGYHPAINRGQQPAYNVYRFGVGGGLSRAVQVGAGWYGEKSAQDVANSHAHNQYSIPERFERVS